MSLIKCTNPECGEWYSDTYKKCPFCEEEELYVKKSRRGSGSGGGRVQPVRTPKIVGPALIAVLLLLIAVLVYAFFGQEIRNALQGGQSDPVQEDPVVADEPVLEVKPTAVEMAEGDIRALTASGAESYVWSSSDETVVSVSEEGVLTAHAVGTVTVTVTDGEGRASAQCLVTVADSTENPNPDGGENPDNTTPVDSSDLTLKTIFGPVAQYEGKYDLTINMRESFALEVEGASGQITWRTSDTKVITVDADGTLHPVGQGSAEITATVGGKTLTCIVRVKW